MLGDLENSDEIASCVKGLLQRADVNDRLPTPVGDLVAAAGLTKTNEVTLSESKIAQAPKKLRKLLRTAMPKVLGLLDRRERVIEIAPTNSTGKQNFITCHEVSHDIFPWQRDLQVLADTGLTLSPAVTLDFEREANQGGAELLFQLDYLQRIARDHPIDIATPIELSQLFGASIHATFRRWIEGLDGAVCGLVLDNELGTNGYRGRAEQIESQLWRKQFGHRRFPKHLDIDRYPFAVDRRGEGELAMVDRDATQMPLRWQTVSNGYNVFALIWLPAKESFIARHRKAPTLVVPGS